MRSLEGLIGPAAVLGIWGIKRGQKLDELYNCRILYLIAGIKI
jgi:hypothetical protein